jgi:hypothetical protein
MDPAIKRIGERLAAFDAWSAQRSFNSARLVQYCGKECSGGTDIALDEVASQIRGSLQEGFRVDWNLKGQQLVICVSESLDRPLEWTKIFKEESLIDIDSVLRDAGIPPRENEKKG